MAPKTRLERIAEVEQWRCRERKVVGKPIVKIRIGHFVKSATILWTACAGSMPAEKEQ